MAAGLSSEFLRGFGEVISQPNITTVTGIINNLRAMNSGRRYFIDEIVNLPVANLSNVTGAVGSTRGTLTCEDLPRGGETVKEVGGGTYGTVYVGQTFFHAYKRMTIKPEKRTSINSIENYCREVYLEAFIQYYLQNDPRYGANICSIQKLYRDSTVKRSKDNINLSRPYIFYYRMQPIPQGTISDYLDRSMNATGLVPFTTFQPKLVELATILQYFERTYGFYHRDLHTGNVMFDGNNIKIIDFGMGCITINGDVYSVTNQRCNSYDLLIYTVALYENYRDRFDQITIEFLRSLFQVSGGNMLDIIREYTRSTRTAADPYGEAMFWQAYYYKLTPTDTFWGNRRWSPTPYVQFNRSFVNFSPQYFAAVVRSYDISAATAATAAAGRSLCEKCWDATVGRLMCCGTRSKTKMPGGKRRCLRCLQKYKKGKHRTRKNKKTKRRYHP